jgi:hypothetical protein
MSQNLPSRTYIILMLNVFCLLWVLAEAINAFFIRRSTVYGEYDLVTILPGSLIAWTALVYSTFIREKQPLRSIYIELLCPLLIYLSVFSTPLINQSSSLGLSLLDFGSEIEFVISLFTSSAVIVPSLILLALPTFLVWIVWIMNIVDSGVSLVKYKHHAA